MSDAESCRLAFKASLELLEEKCGLKIGGKVARFEELKMAVRAPPEVVEIAESNPDLSREERIESVASSTWAKHWGEGMVGLVSPELAGTEREEAIKRLSRILAERVV